MAKDPGLSFSSEEEFTKKMGSTMNPASLQQVIQQLRTNNLSAKNISADSINAKTLAEPVIKDSKEIQQKQEEKKSGQHLLESNKKLTTNIEKLTKTISDSVLGKNKPKADRAEEISGKQQFDYRGIGQRFKEKIMGRGGDKWDPNSLRYKLGSVRGLMGTLGVRGIPLADNAAGIREERLKTATRMTEANAGMQNLKGFAVYGDEIDPKTGKRKVDKEASLKNVERYYQEKGKAAIPAKAALQSEEYNRNKYREAGISDEEYERTSGGKQQMKRLAEAGQGVIDTDPRMQGEKKGAIIFGEDKGDESLADKLNVSEEESSQLKAIESVSEPVKELINITKTENERKTKADSDLLAAIQNMQAAAGGGGALSSIADAASLIGGKGGGKAAGAAKGLGKLGTLAKFASKNSKALKIGGGVLAGGIAAYEGYSDYKDADEQVKSGAITEDEGDIKKTGAVTGAAGGLGGTLAGGAIGQALIPIPGVGFAIGAGIGAFAGSKLGKGIGEWGSKTWKGLTGSGNETIEGKVTQEEIDEVKYGDMIDSEEGAVTDTQAMRSKYYKPASKSQLSKDAAIDKAKMQIYADRQKAAEVTAKSADNAIAKTPSNSQPSNTIVNAPTNVSKQTQNNSIKVPVRDQDHSIKSYYRSRFAT